MEHRYYTYTCARNYGIYIIDPTEKFNVKSTFVYSIYRNWLLYVWLLLEQVFHDDAKNHDDEGQNPHDQELSW